MKIIQSLWTKPTTQNYKTKRSEYFAWVLSCNQALKQYGNIELITDAKGKSILIDQLKLPFTSVKTDLDKLTANPGTWAAGKIYAYSLQEEPFYHIDADVFLWKRLPIDETLPIVAQSLESTAVYPNFDITYQMRVEAIRNYIKDNPPQLRLTEDKIAYNCGIFGGSDLDTIKAYSSTVIKWLTAPQNQCGWDLIAGYSLSIVVEQSMLYCFTKDRGVPVKTLFEGPVTETRARELGYTHLVSGKQEVKVLERLEQRVRDDYPEYYQRVLDLSLPTNLD